MPGRFIACPVCAGEMFYRLWPFLDGDGPGKFMVDCEARHHSTTDPHEYEALRLVRIREDIASTLLTLDLADSRDDSSTSHS